MSTPNTTLANAALLPELRAYLVRQGLTPVPGRPDLVVLAHPWARGLGVGVTVDAQTQELVADVVNLRVSLPMFDMGGRRFLAGWSAFSTVYAVAAILIAAGVLPFIGRPPATIAAANLSAVAAVSGAIVIGVTILETNALHRTLLEVRGAIQYLTLMHAINRHDTTTEPQGG